MVARGATRRHFVDPKQQPSLGPWSWTITAREQPPSVDNHGYAVSRHHHSRASLRVMALSVRRDNLH
ncbi:MAG: hypothetical protein WCC54_31445, partial [Pseudolabrys sp.]